MSQDPAFNPTTGYSVAYENSSEPSQFATETTTIGPLVNFTSGDGSHNLPQAANDLPTYTTTLSGNLFAFEGTGGYYTAQTFADINALPETVVQTYDCTGAVEVQLDKSIFNNKLGTYHYDTDIWDNDTLTLTAAEFKAGITNASQIVTVGKLSTLYSDFTNYVHLYFGIHPSGPLEGFGTLFAGDFNFNPNNSVFGPTDFYNLINSNVSAISQTNSISQLSGTITLANINQLLRNAVSANPFQNRTPITIDPTHNYGVNDGFLAADLMFIPNNGINITLNLNVIQEAFPVPLNNPNVDGSGGWIDASYNTTRDASGTSLTTTWDNTSTVIQNTSSTTTLITRNIQAPLLIIMV
jgi:hypothetical protein